MCKCILTTFLLLKLFAVIQHNSTTSGIQTATILKSFRRRPGCFGEVEYQCLATRRIARCSLCIGAPYRRNKTRWHDTGGYIIYIYIYTQYIMFDTVFIAGAFYTMYGFNR